MLASGQKQRSYKVKIPNLAGPDGDKVLCFGQGSLLLFSLCFFPSLLCCTYLSGRVACAGKAALFSRRRICSEPQENFCFVGFLSSTFFIMELAVCLLFISSESIEKKTCVSEYSRMQYILGTYKESKNCVSITYLEHEMNFP